MAVKLVVDYPRPRMSKPSKRLHRDHVPWQSRKLAGKTRSSPPGDSVLRQANLPSTVARFISLSMEAHSKPHLAAGRRQRTMHMQFRFHQGGAPVFLVGRRTFVWVWNRTGRHDC